VPRDSLTTIEQSDAMPIAVVGPIEYGCCPYRWADSVAGARTHLMPSANARSGKTTAGQSSRRSLPTGSAVVGAGHAIARRMAYYSNRRRHSTLNHAAPMRYIIQEEILPQPAIGLAALRTLTGTGFQPHVQRLQKAAELSTSSRSTPGQRAEAKITTSQTERDFQRWLGVVDRFGTRAASRDWIRG